MLNFSPNEYSHIVQEIRERILSAEVLSNERNLVFIESASLQIRKIIELIAYLSVLVNVEKLNHENRNEYRANKIVETLNEKTTVFYPLPSYMLAPSGNEKEPTLIPLGFGGALSQSEFLQAYKKTGEILHAQHPLKEKLDIDYFFQENKSILKKLKGLLQRHTVGINHGQNKYTFLHVEIDFTNSESTKETKIWQYHAHIFNEEELKSIFNI
uniref:hypothetical protein n=1 Tax=Cellvibrio fontiphilus TaxID=1815559 RepID=UPI002B4C05F1|nr:hypothetical protein [Cellvibrio fontiphilus]